MIDLKSVSSPAPNLGVAESVVAPEPGRKEHPGRAGRAADPSRVARQRLAAGRVPPTETVLGPDERVRIYDTDLDPWRMICSLEMTGTNGRGFLGTGWLVGPKTLVTAGHCVHDRGQMGGWATRIVVTTGRGTAAERRVAAVRFAATDRWVNSQTDPAGPDMDFDIGCIQLEDRLGDDTGWFGVLALPAAELPGYLVNVAGFPGDRGGGAELYHHRKRILHVTDRRLFYDVDTYGGQSGAPAWVYEAADPLPKVVGVHAYGVGGTPAGLGITANSAPRIIPEVVTVIQGWVTGNP